MRCFIYLPPSISEQANSSHIEAVLLKGKSCQIPRNAHINAHIMLDWKQVHFAAASHIHQFTLKVTNLLLSGGWMELLVPILKIGSETSLHDETECNWFSH